MVKMVPSPGVEPGCLAAPVSETGASANSATRGVDGGVPSRIRTDDLRVHIPERCRCAMGTIWSPRVGSNHRPPDPESGALPGCATRRKTGSPTWIRTRGILMNSEAHLPTELSGTGLEPQARFERAWCMRTPGLQPGTFGLLATAATILVDGPRFERGTSRRTTDLQSAGLSLSPNHPGAMAPRARLERATPSFVGWCSDPLS